MRQRRKHFISGILVFLGFALFLTFNKHSKSGLYNYQSEIWADKAGYYIYLPATLHYDWDASLLPDSISYKIGHGFSIDTAKKEIKTKYTYGVALLQSPFYIVADLMAEPLSYTRDGFSLIYNRAINVAAVFYLLAGLLALYKFLRFAYSIKVSLITVISLFLCTHLYYYSIAETGMSHVYSFALCSVYLYLIRRTEFLKNSNWLSTATIGVIIGLIILIRPTNLIFVIAASFLNLKSSAEITRRIQSFINPAKIIIILTCVFIVFLPQLLYWKYASGSYLSYSYAEEGFNWLSPKFMYTWFAPNNGLFLYTPFYILILIASIFMLKRQKFNGSLMLATFTVISYIFSSWWDWSFGCSFGARSYVEYLALFSLPIAHMLNLIFCAKRKFIRVLSFSILILLAILNLKLSYSFDYCYFGSHPWDWEEYLQLIITPT